MNTFEQIVAKMPLLLRELSNQPMFKKDEIKMGQVLVPKKHTIFLKVNSSS